MPQIHVTAPAKINLSLDITGRREDGYHLLSTVMQSLSLADRLTVSLDSGGTGIRLACDQPDIPCDRRNTAWQAAELFLEAARERAAVTIEICKKIPAAAGLAGGSSDAAAVLIALHHLLPGRLNLSQLHELALRIGADVPFCLQGGTVLCEGIGDKLKPLSPFSSMPLLLLNPGFAVSTAWAFREFDQTVPARRPQTSQVIQAMRERDLARLAETSANVLQPVTFSAWPVLDNARMMLEQSGAAVCMMSGSGPTLFALYETKDLRDAARQALTERLDPETRLIACETRSNGPMIIN